MRRFFCTSILCVLLTGCTSLAESARDVLAAGNGVITAAQAQYLTTCQAEPNQGPCVLINQTIALYQVAITATESYCGFQLAPIPPPPDALCQPVSSTAGAIKIAIANLSQVITQLQPLVSPKVVSSIEKETRDRLSSGRFDALESLREGL